MSIWQELHSKRQPCKRDGSKFTTKTKNGGKKTAGKEERQDITKWQVLTQISYLSSECVALPIVAITSQNCSINISDIEKSASLAPSSLARRDKTRAMAIDWDISKPSSRMWGSWPKRVLGLKSGQGVWGVSISIPPGATGGEGRVGRGEGGEDAVAASKMCERGGQRRPAAAITRGSALRALIGK